MYIYCCIICGVPKGIDDPLNVYRHPWGPVCKGCEKIAEVSREVNQRK